MTTEPKPPYTVADLRKWAAKLRRNAEFEGGTFEQTPGECLAQAAAFDALADGIEACDVRTTCCQDEYEEGDVDARYSILRILRGEKLK